MPKTAIPFQGLPALEINYKLAKRLLPNCVICNVHHLHDVMARIAWRLGMEVLYERDILGTGGCIWNAKHILETTDRFIVHNADLIHTIDLSELMAAHKASGRIATLAGLFRSSHNTLSINADGHFLGVQGYSQIESAAEVTRLTFAGIAIYERSFFRYVAEGQHDIKLDWQNALNAGETIGVVNCTNDSSWYDFGTPQGLWEASKFLMDQTGNFSHEYHPLLIEPRPYVSNEAHQEPLPDHLRNVLILEETVQPISEHRKNCIFGRDFKWDILP